MEDILNDEKNWAFVESASGIAWQIHETAKEKGWWDKPRALGEVLMLMVCELAEAFEEHRKGSPLEYEKDGKPEGVGPELADCVIRIFDACVKYDIPLPEIIVKKMEFNKTRPFRHGGKLA